MASGLVLALRRALGLAVGLAACLAVVGVFSFILVGLGGSLGVLPPEAQSLIVAGALLSIALNPLWMSLMPWLQRWMAARWAWARG